MTWPRTIVHADMDAFYAAVEQLENQELRNKPVLIGHPGLRGVVATASYEARIHGVGSAMPMALAKKKCPEAIVVRPRIERYAKYSKEIMQVFRDFSPLVEPLSLDEAFIDLSGTEHLWGSVEEIGEQLKEAVFKATGGLRVSVGISSTKYVAKVASDHNKPDGLTIVSPNDAKSFLAVLPVSRIWGIGKQSQKSLTALRLETIGQVANSDRNWLRSKLGSLGDHIYDLAHAIDPREVQPHREAKSIGAESTLERNVSGFERIRPHLLKASDRIAPQLRAKNLVTGGIRVKLKTASFKILTRQKTLTEPTSTADVIYENALELLEAFDLSDQFRLVGVAAYNLQTRREQDQLSLFESTDTIVRRQQEQLDEQIDKIREKFGTSSLKRGSDLD